jgi:DNA modification methylase
MSDPITNRLYYGDNLDILRRYIPDESVDLVYLDPPFNSNRDYNVIFKDESGNKSDAQLVAFEDTWHWGPDAQRQYEYLTNSAINEGRVPESVSTIIGALRHGIGTNQMMAYLVEMAVRLVELQRVLKPTGSLYLHCDPTASHYLKIVLDAIFGPQNYMAEIIWKRTSSHNDPNRPGRIHDTILYYGRTAKRTWNHIYQPLDAEYVNKVYVYEDARGRYRLDNLTAPHYSPTRTIEWRGTTPSINRQWRFGAEELERLLADGRIQLKPDGTPSINGFKQYLSDSKGQSVQSIWTDIPNVTGISSEKLGYPTQKPSALLERIIEASSNPGDVVLDPFCGCGTALIAAEKLGRRWIGIDVTYLSIAVMKARLADSFALTEVPVIGQPTEVSGARALAEGPDDGRYQFQWWALGLVDARPIGGQKKKGADAGIDGAITFTDAGGRLERVLVSVKSGHVNAGMIRDLKGTLEREKAAIGVFVTLEEPTKPMLQEAAEAGYWHSEVWNRDYQRIQILSIRELVEEEKRPDLPAFEHQPYRRAEKVQLPNAAEQGALFGDK